MGTKNPHYINAELRVDGMILKDETGNGTFIDIDLTLGTYKIAADIASRDAIPTEKRMIGLRVYILATDRTYVLKGGITNTDWKYTQEFERIPDVSILNAGSGSVVVGDITMDKTIVIDYIIERGSVMETGVLTITNKAGTSIHRLPTSNDYAEIDLSKSISSNEIRLNWDDSLMPDGIPSTLIMTARRTEV